jgi:hypothetical protein
MPRRLRIEFEGAIYHVMARGNARQKIVRDDGDRRRLIAGLEQAVVRHAWELLCYVVMGNHLHLLLKTPHPIPEARQLAGLDPKRIIAAVGEFYGLEGSWLSRRGDPHLARPVAAWLCRRHTEATLRQLADSLGLSRADSVPNLTRRLERRLKAKPELSDELAEVLLRAIAPDGGKPAARVVRSHSSRATKRA